MREWRTWKSEEITVSSSVIRLTIGNRRDSRTRRVQITIKDAAINWFSDGTTPDATTGHFAIPTQQPIILSNRNDIEQFRAIRQGSSDAKIDVDYQAIS